MNITFLLNGESVELRGIDPLMTTLDWLRDHRRLTATKEGCNEGDCGACTVLLSDSHGTRTANACILLLPQLHGKSLTTVEAISGPQGQLHPVQQALIDHHASQCGFCTPGFVAQMAANHLAGVTEHETALAGNLCRCTGYAPILRAARAAETRPVPDWMPDPDSMPGPDSMPDPDSKPDPDPFILPEKLRGGPPQAAGGSAPDTDRLPATADDLARLYAATPEATLIAGATDVALWITKALRQPDPVIFLHRCADLQQIRQDANELHIGAAVSMDRVAQLMTRHHPSYGAMLARYGSPQVRAAATIGGNIANGSPIGDNAPPLIALGARLTLRQGDSRRQIAVEDFFLDYGRQDRAPGEFIEAITLPASAPALRVYKISKRFDQDISALLGAFDVTVTDGRVSAARLAFGGMAGTPRRARHAEGALDGQPWTPATLRRAAAAMGDDFTPLSDMRASAGYRMQVAQNLLTRYFHDLAGTGGDLRALTP